MTTRRAAAARAMAAHALTFHPAAPAPKLALRELIAAVAEGWFDGDAGDAITSMVDDHDRDFESLVLLTCGLNLNPADPVVPDGAHALQEHVGCIGLALAVHDPAAHWAAMLARYVALVALVHHRGARRAAMRAMVDAGDELFGALFVRCTGVEL